MSSPSRTYPPMLCQEKFNTKIGEMPLHSNTWNCLRTWNLKKGDWSGQSKDWCI